MAACSLNEPRTQWRPLFFNILADMVKNCTSIPEAALLINQRLWDIFHVHYVPLCTPGILSPAQVCPEPAAWDQVQCLVSSPCHVWLDVLRWRGAVRVRADEGCVGEVNNLAELGVRAVLFASVHLAQLACHAGWASGPSGRVAEHLAPTAESTHKHGGHVHD